MWLLPKRRKRGLTNNHETRTMEHDDCTRDEITNPSSKTMRKRRLLGGTWWQCWRRKNRDDDDKEEDSNRGWKTTNRREPRQEESKKELSQGQQRPQDSIPNAAGGSKVTIITMSLVKAASTIKQSLDGEQDQLRGTCLTDSMKRRMIQRWGDRNLPHLNYTCITDTGAQALLDLDREARRPIDLSALHTYGRELGDEGMTALAEAFVQQSIRNQSANPTWLTISVQSLNNELAVQLAKALKQNLCWYRLELLLWIGGDGFEALIRALHSNHVWKELHLYNNMDDDAGIAVAQALLQNIVWTFLDLSGTIGNTDGPQWPIQNGRPLRFGRRKSTMGEWHPWATPCWTIQGGASWMYRSLT